MKKKSKKKVDTIEKLAQLTADGFADMDSRFADMDSRFSDLDLRFVETKEMLKNIDRRLTAVESKVLGVERRLDSEAMERFDVKSIFTRMERIELAVFGSKRI